MKIKELITELTRPSSVADAKQVLAQYGYQTLGSGVFGTVLARPDKPFVLKLFSTDDYGYVRYLQLIQSRENKHFPVVKGKPIRVTDKYWAVQLERLEETNEYNEHLGSLASEWLSKYTSLSLERIRSAKFEITYQDFSTRFPELVEALELIARYVLIPANKNPDLHSGNVMQRGNTLIITDPIAFAQDVYKPLSKTPRQQNLPMQLPNQNTPPGLATDEDDAQNTYDARQMRLRF